MVVKIWIFPDDLTPLDDVYVKSHMNEGPVKVGENGGVGSWGVAVA